VDLLKQQAPGWIDRVEAEGWESGGCSLHDAAPVAALIDASLFAFKETNVSVELAAGGSRGRTHFLPGKGVRAAVAIREAPCRELVYGLLKGDHRVCVCEPPNPHDDRETSCRGIP
jgi:inosine-uridine nucleoside N-ribohydrolase